MEVLLRQQVNALSNLQKIVRNYKKDGKSRKTKIYLQNRLQSIKENWLEFKELHKQILLLEPEKSQESKVEEYLRGETYSDAYECYLQARSEIEDELGTLFPEVNEQDKEEVGKTERTEEVKLPRIILPKFNGDYTSWASFNDLYVTLIHKNRSLSSVQKLHYLKSSLQGEAEQLLRHFTITDMNYLPAWTMLKDRYDNPRILIKTHLKTLFAQPQANRDSAVSIRKLIDTTNESVQSLQNLKVNTDGWDIILTHLVTERLPPETKKLWEQSIGPKREFPTYTELKCFLEGQFRALEALGSGHVTNKPHYNIMKQRKSNNNSHYRQIQEEQHPMSSFHIAKTYNCVNCSGSHPLRQCPQFLQLNYEGRRTVVSQKGLCSNCLGIGHIAAKCPSKNSCFICKHKHHTLLHDKSTILNKIDPQQSPIVEPSSSTNNNAINTFHASLPFAAHEILLATALVNVSSAVGKQMVLRALIDPGSQMTLITQNAVTRLNLKGIPISARIKGLGNQDAALSQRFVSFNLQSLINVKFKLSAQALVLSELTGMLPSKSIVQNASWNHLNNLPLADPQYYKPGRVDMIIGADIFCKIILDGLKLGPEGSPIAQQTQFGWILSGQVGKQGKNDVEVIHLHTRISLEDQLRQFWELEEIKPMRHLTSEEKQCEEFYERTTTRLLDGRYEVRLPFKNEIQPALGKSSHIALLRFKHLEKKFDNHPNIRSEYVKCLEEYIELSHMSPVVRSEREFISSNGDDKYYCNYLPHHAVYKESTTTKLRVVFDASSKTSNGSSLNDNLLVGPTLQEDMMSILLRWRKHAIVVTADIEKMYRQIKVNINDAQYQRIFWRSSSSQTMKEYFLNTVTFGTSCAPYLAVKTLRKLAKDEEHRFPEAAKVTHSDFYVDDLLTGTNSMERALKLQKELISLLQAGGFNLRKWKSNHQELLKDIPQENREIDGLHSIDLQTGVKTLGIFWCPKSDVFRYKLSLNKTSDGNVTKREFLSDLSKIFDPLGFLVPVIIQPKILMQSLWLRGVNWDNDLPTDILQHWQKFRQELNDIESITIPRWIQYHEEMDSFELHGFCDASLNAYAAAIYGRVVKTNGEIHTRLLMAKSKVAPIKQVTLPRLELCGAALLTKLYTFVKQSLRLNCKMFAWTDSMIVLSWLQEHPSRWKIFVGNRVAEIQTDLPTKFWRHVPTSDNPADCATRGLSPSQLKEHKIWWEGPDWLKRTEECWPQRRQHEHIELEKKVFKIHLVIPSQTFTTEMTRKFSSLAKLLRITSFVFRFVKHCQKKQTQFNDWVTLEEMNTSLMFWIKRVQDVLFKDDIENLKANKGLKQGTLLKLNPFLDGTEILRVGGRLSNSTIPWSERHPIILPSKHPLTRLIIDEIHLTSLPVEPS